ncbi:membrane hypothetical protein [Verrucomicrobia bacterium]|nr:membrane hypothetical protein [Verrucomicrobiota bacterium]
MSTILFLLLTWMTYAVAAAVVLTPIVFLARKRVHWHSWELLCLLFPFFIWVGLDFATGGKSLANLAIEPVILGLTLGVGALARVAMSTRMPEDRAALVAHFGSGWRRR